MAPISLKIVQDDGAVTRTVQFESSTKVADAYAIIKEKILTADDGKEYGLFLSSADDERSGVWLEGHRPLDYYMLRDGDCLLYLPCTRTLRVRTLDGSVKTLQVDESKHIGELMLTVCGKLGITNHDEYGLCHEEVEEMEEAKENKPMMGTLTLKRKVQQREKDAKMEQLSKKLKTDDNVEWLDQHKTLREIGVDQKETVLLKRRLFYSDRNVDSRDPVQLNLLYVQTRDAILNGHHPVTEEQAQECKVRWIHIRDVNRRILRKSVNNPNLKKKLYKYEKDMAFMRPFYREIVFQKSAAAAAFESDDNDDNNDDVNVVVVEKVEAGSDESEEPVEKPKKKRVKPTKRKETRKKRNIVQEEPEDSASFDNAVAQELDPKDPVDAFLLGIGATLKMFNPYHLNLAKSKIFSVVQEHELQQIVRQPQREQLDDVDVKLSSCGQNLFLH